MFQEGMNEYLLKNKSIMLVMAFDMQSLPVAVLYSEAFRFDFITFKPVR